MSELVTKKNSKKWIIFVVAGVILVALITLGVFIVTGAVKQSNYNKEIDAAEKYYAELDYEEAIAHYLSAIEIDPTNLSAYVGIYDSYVALADIEISELNYAGAIDCYDHALTILKEGREYIDSDELEDMIDDLNDAKKEAEELQDSGDINEVAEGTESATEESATPGEGTVEEGDGSITAEGDEVSEADAESGENDEAAEADKITYIEKITTEVGREIIKHEYYEDGRIVRLESYSPWSNSSCTYEYDGNVCFEYYENFYYVYEYDDGGHLISERQYARESGTINGIDIVYIYEYDDDNNLVKEIARSTYDNEYDMHWYIYYYNGNSLVYREYYYNLMLPNGALESSLQETTYYDEEGRIIYIEYSDDNKTEYFYDEDNRLAYINYANGKISEYLYEYDEEGRLIKESIIENGSVSQTIEYIYADEATENEGDSSETEGETGLAYDPRDFASSYVNLELTGEMMPTAIETGAEDSAMVIDVFRSLNANTDSMIENTRVGASGYNLYVTVDGVGLMYDFTGYGLANAELTNGILTGASGLSTIGTFIYRAYSGGEVVASRNMTKLGDKKVGELDCVEYFESVYCGYVLYFPSIDSYIYVIGGSSWEGKSDEFLEATRAEIENVTSFYGSN